MVTMKFRRSLWAEVGVKEVRNWEGRIDLVEAFLMKFSWKARVQRSLSLASFEIVSAA